MVNRLIPYATSAIIAISAQVASAQETVRWLVCNIAEQCDLDKSTVSTSLTPLIESRLWDTPWSLSINLQCISWNSRLTASQIIQSDDNTWIRWEISRLQEWQLIPYILQYEPEDASWSERLRGSGINCKLWNIEISLDEESLPDE